MDGKARQLNRTKPSENLPANEKVAKDSAANNNCREEMNVNVLYQSVSSNSGYEYISPKDYYVSKPKSILKKTKQNKPPDRETFDPDWYKAYFKGSNRPWKDQQALIHLVRGENLIDSQDPVNEVPVQQSLEKCRKDIRLIHNFVEELSFHHDIRLPEEHIVWNEMTLKKLVDSFFAKARILPEQTFYLAAYLNKSTFIVSKNHDKQRMIEKRVIESIKRRAYDEIIFVKCLMRQSLITLHNFGKWIDTLRQNKDGLDFLYLCELLRIVLVEPRYDAHFITTDKYTKHLKTLQDPLKSIEMTLATINEIYQDLMTHFY